MQLVMIKNRKLKRKR